MFSLAIVQGDDFLDMPLSTQALYFHLGMVADDDGFVAPRKVMRMIGAADDELKVLIAKKFAIIFKSGIVLITNWKENNTIKKDRKKPTIYVEEFSQVTVDNAKTYHVSDPSWIQNGSTLSPQYRIVEDSIVENSKVKGSINTLPPAASERVRKKKEYSDDFNTFWTAYPKKKEKIAAFTAWNKMASYRPPIADILAKIEALKESDLWKKESGQFIPYPERWIKRGGWDDEVTKTESVMDWIQKRIDEED
jgi:hypothetical protein